MSKNPNTISRTIVFLLKIRSLHEESGLEDIPDHKIYVMYKEKLEQVNKDPFLAIPLSVKIWRITIQIRLKTGTIRTIPNEHVNI